MKSQNLQKYNIACIPPYVVLIKSIAWCFAITSQYMPSNGDMCLFFIHRMYL